MSDNTDRLLQVLIDSNNKTNETNEKLAERIGDLANKMERSLEKHEHTDKEIEGLQEFKDYAKPIVDRSAWWQSSLSDVFVKFILPAIVIGVLAAAGYNLYPSQPAPQKQEQTNGN